MFIFNFFAFYLILTKQEAVPPYAEIQGSQATGEYADANIANLDQILNTEFTATSSGNLEGYGIDNAFDYNSDSYWQSHTNIDGSNHPSIEITFNNINDLDCLIYYPHSTTDPNDGSINYPDFPQILHISASIGNSRYQLKYIVQTTNEASSILIKFPRILWCDKLLIEFHSPNGVSPTCKKLYFIKVHEPTYKQVGIQGTTFACPNQILRTDCASVTSSGDLPKISGTTMGTSGVDDLFSSDEPTHWVALNPNTADFKNNVSYQFKKIECITEISYASGYNTNRSVTPNTRAYHGFPYVMNIYARNITSKNFELVYVCTGYPSAPFTEASLFEFPDGVWTDELKIVFEEVSLNNIYKGVDDYKPAARMLFVRRRKNNQDFPRFEYEPTKPNELNDVIISNAKFDGIQSPDFGGAVYLSNCALDCSSTTFTSCQSSKAGGGIYLKINNPDLNNNNPATFNGLTFTGCQSGYGGAICVIAKTGTDITSVVGCTFNNNIALNSTLGGSALFVYTTKAKVQRCTFTGSSGSSTIIRYATSDPSEEPTTATILSTDFEFEVRDCIFEDQHQDSTFYINIDESIQQSPHILLTNNQLTNSAQLSKTTFKDQHHNEATTQTSNNNNRTNNRNIFLMILIPSLVVISLLFLLIIYRHHNDNQENSQETNNNA